MRGSLIWIIKLALTAAILTAIVWKLDVDSTMHTLSSASQTAVATGVVLVFLQAVLSAKRLSLVLSTFGCLLSMRAALRITLEGMFFSQTFVSFFGGDAQRIWRIRRCGLPLRDATSAITLDRLIGLVMNHGLLLVTLPWLLSAMTTNSANRVGLLVVAVAGLGAIAVALAFGFMRGRTGLTARLPVRLQASTLVRLLLEISTVGRHLLVPNTGLITAGAISFVIAAINSFIFFLVLLGWNIPAGAALGCALMVTAVMEIAMLPISIAGWGVREATAILAFSSFGVPAETAFGSSVAYALMVLAIGLVGGAVWLFDQREISELIVVEMPSDVDAEQNVSSDGPR